MGLSEQEVVSNIITSLTSDGMISPSYGVDPKSGNLYMLTVQFPDNTVRSLEDLKGNHDISDFDLDLLGEVVNCQAETENTGWVIVRSSHLLNDLSFLPLSQFGHAIRRSSNLAGCGDEIPLRRV